MTTFGIIAEGETDQIVIENILLGFVMGDDDADEPFVRYVQPPNDATDRARDVGNAGWGMVFKQFEGDGFTHALQHNDFVVVQIDTDVSEQKGYDVPWRIDGRELSAGELVAAVVAKFRSLIGPERWEKYERRVIFAISVHALECWLLPAYFTDNKREKIAGCLDAVNHARRKKNLPTLSKPDGSKLRDSYRDASAPFSKRKTLLKHAPHNPSLALFVDELTRKLSPAPPTEP